MIMGGIYWAMGLLLALQVGLFFWKNHKTHKNNKVPDDFLTAMAVIPRGLTLHREMGTWGFTPFSCSAHADPLEQSNFAFVKAGLEKIDPKGKYWESALFVHWATGKFDQILVDLTATKLVEFIYECWQSLREYPVLDEDDFSRRETEKEDEDFEDFCRYEVARLAEYKPLSKLLDADGWYSPTDADIAKIREIWNTVDSTGIEEALIKEFYELPEVC